jgi:hypothetical protein
MTLAALDDTLRLDRIADAANRAMTSFYTVYARAIAAEQTPTGKPPAVVGNEEQDPASRMDAMRQLAATTDGLAIMTRRPRRRPLAHRGRYDCLRRHHVQIDEQPPGR